MACGKTIIYLFSILATLNLIWGQEGSGNEPQHSGAQHSGPPCSGEQHPGPEHSGLQHSGPQNSENDRHAERASMPFSGFPGGSGGLGSFPFASMLASGRSGAPEGSGSDGMSGSQMPNSGSNPLSSFFSMFAPREEQLSESGLPKDVVASEHAEDDHPEHQNRFFFHLLSSRITSCNYTTQAGSTCLSCRQALTCRSNNIGILRTCTFLHPYCNNGRCSIFPGTACTSTTAAATSATEATTAAAATTAAGA